MAQSDALWNEVCRILNHDFFEQGQPITPVLIVQLIRAVNLELTDDTDSV